MKLELRLKNYPGGVTVEVVNEITILGSTYLESNAWIVPKQGRKREKVYGSLGEAIAEILSRNQEVFQQLEAEAKNLTK